MEQPGVRIDGGAAAGGSELRLALAMRGGVSLAVWIGGACAEIDELRRTTDGGGGFWSSVLGLSDHERVVVDVLAGASAGGLNGVLYSASQVYDFDFRRIRDIWLRVGSADQLVRREEPWPSLFAGDGYFFETVRAELEELVRSGRAATREGETPAPVDLRLSATAVEPMTRPVPSPTDEQLVERRHASGFHFAAPAESWLTSDFPLPGQGHERELQEGLARLALAARATSSFPGAFEAAAVRAARPVTFGDRSPRQTTETGIDNGNVFVDRCRGDAAPDVDSEAQIIPVSDGGILDNIPIARALDAVADTPASGPTRRVLVYLQPGAPTARTEKDPLTLEQRRSTLAVARGFVGARIGNETIERDIAQLEAHNRAVDHARLIRQSGLGTVDGPDELTELALSSEQRRNYVRVRADADAELVKALLLDPVQQLGEDRFPATAAGIPIGDEVWRSPLGTWSEAERRALMNGMAVLFAKRRAGFASLGNVTPQGVVEQGARPIQRLTMLLLEWAQLLEALELPDVGRHKAVLYRALSFERHVIEAPRRLAWVAAFASVEARLEAVNAALADAEVTGPSRERAERRWRRRATRERTELAGATSTHLNDLCRADPALVDDVMGRVLDGQSEADDPRANAKEQTHRSIDGFVGEVLAQLDRDLDESFADFVAAVAGDLESDDAAAFEAALDGLLPSRQTDRSSVGEPRDDTTDYRRALLDDVLVPTMLELGRALPRRDDEHSDLDSQLERAVSVAAHLASTVLLHTAIVGRGRTMGSWPTSDEATQRREVIEILASLEVVASREFSAALPGRRPVEFVRLSSAQRTPLAQDFTALLAASDGTGQWWDPGKPREAQGGIHVDVKLAGNELANFSAFFVEDWRRNDWMWGRLDTVPTLVDLLVRPEQLRGRFAGAGELRQVIEAAIESRGSRWLTDRVLTDERRAAVAEECRRLFEAEPGEAGVVSIAALRDVLVAARQWEILAEEREVELGDRLAADVAGYDVGAQTLSGLRSKALVRQFSQIGETGTNVVLWNLETGPGTPQLPGPVERTIRHLVPRVANRAARKYLLGRWLLPSTSLLSAPRRWLGRLTRRFRRSEPVIDLRDRGGPVIGLGDDDAPARPQPQADPSATARGGGAPGRG